MPERSHVPISTDAQSNRAEQPTRRNAPSRYFSPPRSKVSRNRVGSSLWRKTALTAEVASKHLPPTVALMNSSKDGFIVSESNAFTEKIPWSAQCDESVVVADLETARLNLSEKNMSQSHQRSASVEASFKQKQNYHDDMKLHSSPMTLGCSHYPLHGQGHLQGTNSLPRTAYLRANESIFTTARPRSNS